MNRRGFLFGIATTVMISRIPGLLMPVKNRLIEPEEIVPKTVNVEIDSTTGEWKVIDEPEYAPRVKVEYERGNGVEYERGNGGLYVPFSVTTVAA